MAISSEHKGESTPKASGEIVKIENADIREEDEWIQRYPLLRDKSQEELDGLNKAVLKKLDWRFLPCITAMLLMNYLDRINVSNARLAGMQKDLHMSDVEWSAGISLFYVGYIISQVPANVLIAKSSPRIMLPCMMLGWSACTICMPAVTSAWGFMLCRFLVGLTEGPFVPVVALLTSSWYTKQESPLRMGIWHAGNIISNVFSGLLSAAILTNMDNVAGLSAWQWFLLLEGIVSILVAIPGFWLLPNFPNNTGTYFFTPEELEMSQYRQLVSAGGISEDDEGDYWGGFWMAVKDPFTWLFAGMHFFIIIAQSFKDFFPSIVGTLGFTKVQTYLVQAPPYVISYIVTLVISWSSGRRLEHCWHIVGAIAMSLVGAAVMISTLNVGARYFSMILLCSGPFVALNIQLSWETTVVPRPRTKRAALIAIANCVSSVSHWFTPYFFLTNQEPRYQLGGGCIIVGAGLTIVFCVATRYWCIRKNKVLEKEEERTGVVNSWRYAS
ncbi:MFS general substrate transporter [Aaosphaeria arxii CBS 175.79]|uniref:MFS general substrate transporter n=1 Tax=Aaosphaeria arxii CBS 175.79 TaxID=1450172 RepID=A0A6A5X622_9PLEO|nr:MFS general substrate transporter [Aaosphaeria arxii CBS 175.79]KAF2008403.1 MFS general substrate transporter [Aaosphaeria arxii CBS 175.79]